MKSPVKDNEEIDGDFDDLIVNKTHSFVERRESGDNQMKMSELKVSTNINDVNKTRNVSSIPQMSHEVMPTGQAMGHYTEESSVDPDQRDQAIDLLTDYVLKQP